MEVTGGSTRRLITPRWMEWIHALSLDRNLIERNNLEISKNENTRISAKYNETKQIDTLRELASCDIQNTHQ